jgi:hypothetical protein
MGTYDTLRASAVYKTSQLTTMNPNGDGENAFVRLMREKLLDNETDGKQHARELHLMNDYMDNMLRHQPTRGVTPKRSKRCEDGEGVNDDDRLRKASMVTRINSRSSRPSAQSSSSSNDEQLPGRQFSTSCYPTYLGNL